MNEKKSLLSEYALEYAKRLERELNDSLLRMAEFGVFDKQPECVVCHKTFHEYQDGDAPDNHPFCKDNLVYLEWLAGDR